MSEVTATFSVPSLFVLCTSLDTDTYTVPKTASSYSPFNSTCNIQLDFKEITFEDDEVELNFHVSSASFGHNIICPSDSSI